MCGLNIYSLFNFENAREFARILFTAHNHENIGKQWKTTRRNAFTSPYRIRSDIPYHHEISQNTMAHKHYA